MSHLTQLSKRVEEYIDRQWALLRRKPNVLKEEGKAVAAWLQPEEIKQLDAIAATLGMSRSEYMRASFINNAREAEAAGVLSAEMATPA